MKGRSLLRRIIRRTAGTVGASALWALAIQSGTVSTVAAEANDDEEVMSLPPLLVEERLQPLRWRYLEAPGLEVLSLCDDAVTREFVRRVQRLNHALRLMVPLRFQGSLTVPDIQILFNEDLRRAKSQEVMEEMLRREGSASPNSGPKSEGRAAAAILAPWQRRRVYFLPNLRLSDVDATVIFAATHESEPNFAEFTFVPDRVRDLLERRVPALPEWFVAGTVGLYEQSQLRPDGVTIGPAIWISEAESRALLSDEDHPRMLWPMHELLAARPPNHREAEDDLTRVWRSQCALFLRWALTEDNGARREALWTLVERLDTEPLNESLFRACLGLGFADVRDQLSDYLPLAVAKGAELRASRMVDQPELKPRAATVVEIARIRGEWERMQINFVKRRFPELTQKYIDQARATLDNAYGSGERDPQLLAIIGLTECDVGNPAGARAYLEAAARAQVARPRVYIELARQRFADQSAIAGEKGWSAPQVATVLEPLRRARDLSPPLLESCGILAETLTRAAEAPTAEDLDWLNGAVTKFPRVVPLLLRTIYLNAINGRTEEAIALAQTGLRAATEEESRERLSRVLARLTGAAGSE